MSYIKNTSFHDRYLINRVPYTFKGPLCQISTSKSEKTTEKGNDSNSPLDPEEEYKIKYAEWQALYNKEGDSAMYKRPMNPVLCSGCGQRAYKCVCEDEWCQDIQRIKEDDYVGDPCKAFKRHSECCGKNHANHMVEDLNYPRTSKKRKVTGLPDFTVWVPMNDLQKECRNRYLGRRRRTKKRKEQYELDEPRFPKVNDLGETLSQTSITDTSQPKEWKFPDCFLD